MAQRNRSFRIRIESQSFADPYYKARSLPARLLQFVIFISFLMSSRLLAKLKNNNNNSSVCGCQLLEVYSPPI